MSPFRGPTPTFAHCPTETPPCGTTSQRCSRCAGTRSRGGSPLLGDAFVCLSTFALDASRFAGAVTVARDPSRFRDDPFARLFPGTVVASDIFCEVGPPAGPPIERYAGAPWPGGHY